MRGLVRNHGLIRSMGKPAAAAMSTALVGLNVLVFERLKTGSFLGVDDTGLFELMILLGGLFILFLDETGRRGTRWQQALPVDSRTLWTAHVRALVLAVTLVILGMLLVILGFTLLISRFDPLEFLRPDAMLVHFARPWLVMLAAALCLGAWRSRLADPLKSPGWGRWRLGLAAAALVVLVLLQSVPLYVALAPALAAYAWARREKALLPPALELADRPEVASASDDHVPSVNGRRTVHWILVRQLFKWPMTWILGVPMTFLLGLVQGGAFSYALDADFARYFNIWITIYMFIAFVGHFLENIHRVDHLPISRGLMMRWLIVPNLVGLLAGGFVGTMFDLGRDRGEAIRFENDATLAHHGLLVPVDLWQPVWGDPPGTVTAPWGETRPLQSHRVFSGLPLHLVKPFTTGTEASPDFVAWQIGRAAEAAYGVALDSDHIRDFYLVAGEDGAVRVRDEGLTLVADHLVPVRGPVGPILGLLMAFTINAALVTFWIIFRLCGPGVTGRRIKGIFWTAMGVLMVFHLGGYALLMTRTVREWTVTALVEGLAGRLGAMGFWGWSLPWTIGLLAALFLWHRCLRAFARVEAVKGATNGTCWT